MTVKPIKFGLFGIFIAAGVCGQTVKSQKMQNLFRLVFFMRRGLTQNKLDLKNLEFIPELYIKKKKLMIKQMIGKNNMFLKKIKIKTHCKSNFMYFVIFLSRVLFFSIPPLSSYICNFSPPLALVWPTFAYKNVSFLQRDEQEYYYRY